MALQHCFCKWLFLPQMTRLLVVACSAALGALMHLQKDYAVRHLDNMIGLVSSPYHKWIMRRKAENSKRYLVTGYELTACIH